jgi:glycyl-tRNA synthetase alpha chain
MRSVSTELTYGLERLAMFCRGVESLYDLDWNVRPKGDGGMTYGDVYLRSEREFSAFNFEATDPEILFRHFEDAEKTCASLLARQPQLALPAYDQCLKASHIFNLLDARGVISVTERQAYIARVRTLAKGCCEAWLAGIFAPAPRHRLRPLPNSFSSSCPMKSPRACRRAPRTICAVSSRRS